MAAVSKLPREAIERGIHKYLDHHREFPGENYKFNIRLGVVQIPEAARARLTEEELNEISQTEIQDRLRGFVDGIIELFPWIKDWAQGGRSGGWLVLDPDEPALNQYGELEDLAAGRRRLRDLDKIDQMVREGVAQLESDVASHAFWREIIPDYHPGGGGRKHWDPRKYT